MRLFGSERIAGVVDKLGMKEDEALEASMLSKSIEKAQKKVEDSGDGFSDDDFDDMMSIFKKRKEYVALIRGNGGSWLQAYVFYGFLVCTQTVKKALRLTGIDWIRKIRYRKGNV